MLQSWISTARKGVVGCSRESSHCALGDDEEDGEGDDDEEEEDDQDEADEADDAAETDDLDIDEDDDVACFASDCLSGDSETAEPSAKVLVGAASNFLWSPGAIQAAHLVDESLKLYEEGGRVLHEDNGHIEQWDEAQETELADADGAGECCAGNCASPDVEQGEVACSSAGSSGEDSSTSSMSDFCTSSMPPLGPLGTNFMSLGASVGSNGNDEGANDQSVCEGGVTISCHEEHHALVHHYCASAPLPQVRKKRGPVLCVCQLLQFSDQS